MACCLKHCSRSIHTFKVPTNEDLKLKWEKSLKLKLKQSYRVCSNHFKDSDIIHTWTSGRGLYKISVKLKRWKLKKNAIPCLNISELKSESIDITPNSIVKLENGTINPLTNSIPIETQMNKTNNTLVPSIKPCTSTLLQEIKNEDIDAEYDIEEDTLIQLILKHSSIINLPKNWFFSSENVGDNIVISFHKLSPFTGNFKRYIEKQIIITNGLKNVSRVILILNFNKIPLMNIGLNIEVIDSIESLQILLHELNEIKCCQGVALSDDYIDVKKTLEPQYVEYDGHRWHKKCLTVIKHNEDDLCLWCKYL